MGFDKKEDFRSSFKEDRKSNEAPKKCRKQAEEAHGRAPGSTTVLQHPGPSTAGRTASGLYPFFYSRGTAASISTNGEGTKMDAQGIEAIDMDKRASGLYPFFYSRGTAASISTNGEGSRTDAQGIEAIDMDKRASGLPLFHYSRGTAASETSPVGSDIFLFDHHLTHLGGKLKLQFNRGCKSKFLPFKVAKSIPFSSDKLPEILGLFSVRPNSPQAKVIEDTIAGCEDRAVAVVDNKYCATSLETLVDYAVSNIGSQVKVLSTTIDNDTTVEYTVEKAQKVSSDGNFVCHKLIYPYAVFYCHRVRDTDAYVVSLVDANGQKSKGAAVCHRNTSSWHPDHLTFHALHVKPGTVPVCHFVGALLMI